jgi:hypothetical protein
MNDVCFASYVEGYVISCFPMNYLYILPPHIKIGIFGMSISLNNEFLTFAHRNQSISRKGTNIISRRPSHGHLVRRCCPQAFLRIFSEVTYIRTVGNSSLLKIYTLPNHTITIGVCILETQLLGLLYGCGASFVQKWPMPWMSANI